MTMTDLEDKIIVALGGTSGLGLAIARGLHAAGATVVPSSRDRARIEAARDAFGDPDLPVVPCDTTRSNDLETLRDTVVDRYGRIDGLVHAAGVHRRETALATRDDDWRSVIETNLTGTFLACRTFAPPMIERGQGRIVTISSMGAQVGLRNAAAYCASKAGVEQLTKVLAVEWAEHGVLVNAIAPGFFITDLNAEILAPGTRRRERVDARTPLGRTGEPDELVAAAIYLCSDAASFTTGTTLTIDGGFLAQGI